MSIVLFVSAAAFTDYMTESAEGGLASDQFDLIYAAESDASSAMRPDALLELLFSEQNVTGGTYTKKQFLQGDISREYVTAMYADRFADFGMEREDAAPKELGISGYLYFVADAEFNRLLEKYNLKEADYYDRDKPLGIALDRNIEFDRRLEKYVTLDSLQGDGCVIEGLYYVEIDGYYRKDSRIDENGNKVVLYQSRDNENDIIELPYEESFAKYTLRSEKTIEEAPFFVSRSTPVAINMIYPYSMLESVVPEAALNQFRNTEYFLTSSNHTASFENLATVLTENGLSSRQLFDYAANAETNRNVVTIIRVFAYGFIVLISLIAAANVFNTISTNISLRRREFAMLKSVGMTQKGFRRMMNYECLLYGSKALLLGLPVSCGITYLIYRAVTTAYETSFHLPWAAIGIAVLSVFLVVFATMMYAMSKVKKDNPIDALKMRICKEEKNMYNHEATAHRKLHLKSLLICWGIILGGYLLIRMVFLIFGLQLHLTAQGICLALLPYCFGALYLWKCCKKQKPWFYVLGLLLPAVAEKLTLYFLGAYLCGISPFRVTAVMEAIGTIEPYAVLFTRMPMRYAVNLLFFNGIYILCSIAFSALCILGLSLLQKRTEDEL